MKIQWTYFLIVTLMLVVLAPILNVLAVAFLALLGLPHWGVSEAQVVGSVIWLMFSMAVVGVLGGGLP